MVDGAGHDGTTQKITPDTVSKSREGSREKLRRRLRDDLDNIVLMAMRKEPLRRYASVEQLSEDIRRVLEGLPVRARKPTLVYLSSKFLRRHKRRSHWRRRYWLRYSASQPLPCTSETERSGREIEQKAKRQKPRLLTNSCSKHLARRAPTKAWDGR